VTTDLKQTIQHDLTTAMKARDTVTVSTLRMALSAITNAEVAGDASVTLDDAAILTVLATEVKRRTESAEIYTGAGRQELADKELAERAVLERYLPAEIGDDELTAIVAEEVAAAEGRGATGPKAMGTVIAAVRERTAGTASGSRIAATVKRALTGT
jgi:uncharacterized protein YqeY